MNSRSQKLRYSTLIYKKKFSWIPYSMSRNTYSVADLEFFWCVLATLLRTLRFPEKPPALKKVFQIFRFLIFSLFWGPFLPAWIGVPIPNRGPDLPNHWIRILSSSGSQTLDMRHRRKIRLIESNAKCRYLKKFTCKGTLRPVFICLSSPPLLGFC